VGLSRVIRLAYFEHTTYVPLLLRAWDLWLELEGAAQERLLVRTGGIYVGEPTSQMVTGSTRSALEHSLPHELLDAAEIERRYPPLKLRPGWVGLFEAQAGVLLPERCIEAHLALAERRGAALRFSETATHWEANGSGIRVATRSGVFAARLAGHAA
jgi:sarcosine oxidase